MNTFRINVSSDFGRGSHVQTTQTLSLEKTINEKTMSLEIDPGEKGIITGVIPLTIFIYTKGFEVCWPDSSLDSLEVIPPPTNYWTVNKC